MLRSKTFSLMLLLCSVLPCLGQSLPVINKNGQSLYEPDRPFHQLSVARLNGSLFADVAGTADIGASINAAWVSQKGKASAMVELDPSGKYTLGSQMVIPNNASYGIHRATLDCHGATITIPAGFSSSVAVLVLGENATGITETGELKNCRFVDNAGLTAIVQLRGRLGFSISNNSFTGKGNGATGACVSFVNTTDSGGQGYEEDNVVMMNGFGGCVDDIAFHGGPGNSPSWDYNWLLTNHWQLGGGETGVHFYGDEGYGGANGQGVRISGTVNTAGGPTVNVVKVELGSGILGNVDLDGENTAQIATFNGLSGPIYVEGRVAVRAGGVVNGAVLNGGKSYFSGRKGLMTAGTLWQSESPTQGIQELQSKVTLDGNNFIFYGADRGDHYWSVHQLMDCQTAGVTGQRDVFSPTVNCYNGQYWTPGLPVMYGKGWGVDDSGNAMTPLDASIPQPDLVQHRQQEVGLVLVNGQTQYHGFVFDDSSNLTEYMKLPNATGTSSNTFTRKTWDTSTGAFLPETEQAVSGGINRNWGKTSLTVKAFTVSGNGPTGYNTVQLVGDQQCFQYGVGGSSSYGGYANKFYVYDCTNNKAMMVVTPNTGAATWTGTQTAPGFQLASATVTCASSQAGQFNYVAGASGVKDVVQVCAKDATNAYAWRTIY